MQRWFFETFNELNHGKFMVGRFDYEDWTEQEQVTDGGEPRFGLLRNRGWGSEHLLVLDLQTGEGAMFGPGGNAHADLNKHKVWVCPMFEAFLAWLYEQDRTDLDKLPRVIELPDAPKSWAGYRRPGQEGE